MKRRKLSVLSAVIFVTVIVTFLVGGYAKPAAAEGKTLKVGLLCNFEWPLGLDMKRLLDAVVPAYNERGGLAIGGDIYKIDLIAYNSKNDPETGRAAVERLVFRDKVKFLLGDITADAWIPVTEENKVLSIVSTPSLGVLEPKLKYTFQGSYLNTSMPEIWAWFVENYPEVKTVGAMFPDIMHGHGDAMQLEQLCGIFNLNLVETIFYQPDTTDFSAFVTRMKTVNPEVFTTAGSGPPQQELLWKTLREAGYEGLNFAYRGITPGSAAKVISLDILDGTVFALADYDMDPPVLPVTKEARDAYIAKYGSWDDPAAVFAITWYLLIEALEQAQSIDPDKVAAAIANGLAFDSPFGPAMMISRPDQGNPRTIDALYGINMATFEKGKVKVIDIISVEKAFELIKKSEIFGVYPD
jgi:branched-chain amino acid transport system substrate-binding protein